MKIFYLFIFNKPTVFDFTPFILTGNQIPSLSCLSFHHVYVSYIFVRLPNILSIGLKGGDAITIHIEGEDEQDAGEAINKFFTEELKHL